MTIAAGTKLGSYELVAQIGAGGMGEVYRAHDSKLGRDVAIKVLPEAFAQDPERLSRFQREAKMLASLNHPNIAAIYGLEDGAGRNYLVMELVPGETLAERVKREGALPVEEALAICKQIAEALEAAHEKGIIHRDLKPANVKVTPEGKVKVLDFGLAKAFSGDTTDSNPSQSPTLSAVATMQGVLLGTAAYMSPEQARGKAVDKRTDIWAFGCVLYELLTGKQAFTGEDVTEILAAVVMKEPAFDALPAKIPPAIRTLLSRCLEKNLKRRLQHVGEGRIVIEDVLSGSLPAEMVAAQRKGPSSNIRVAWAVAAIAIVAALALAFVHFRGPTEETRILKMTVLPPEKAMLTDSLPAVSPDGRRLAFVANVNGQGTLWVRNLDSLAARPLPGTEGANDPFWSPDSRFVAFFAGGKLKKIDVAGGPALSLCDAGSGIGGSWSRSDVIVFAPTTTGGLFRVPAAGGDATPVTALDQASGETSHRFPWFLPDGRHFLYTDRNADSDKSAVYVADLDSNTRRRVLVAPSNAVYSPPGYLLFVREQTLMAQPFDASNAQAIGGAVPIAERVDSVTKLVYGQGQFSASQNGVLAYTSGGAGQDRQLTWFDRSGKVVGTVGMPGDLGTPAISPDGTRVVFYRLDTQTSFYDLWLYDLAHGSASRFTFNSKSNINPVWSPDGSHIAFQSTRDGVPNLYQKASSGAAQDEALDKAARDKRPMDWSRDGRYIIEEIRDAKSYDIWVLPLFDDRKPFPYLQNDFNERFAKLSPNGQWLAYVSDETKRDEVYVQGFSGTRSGSGGKWQVSTSGGIYPVWSRDGKELFFIGSDQKLMAVEVNGGAKFEAGVPKPLFETRGATFFDVSKDGRFLIPTQTEQSAGVPITVVVNWTAGLKK